MGTRSQVFIKEEGVYLYHVLNGQSARKNDYGKSTWADSLLFSYHTVQGQC